MVSSVKAIANGVLRPLVLATILLLLVLSACLPAMPEIKHQGAIQPENQTAPREYIINATAPEGQENATVSPEPGASAIDVNEAETVARKFAAGLHAYSAAAMYPYLSKRLTDRYTPEQLERALVYFKPKDRMYAEFSSIAASNMTSSPSGYVALLRYGNDYIGWQMLELPLALEDGWKVVWFDNLSTNKGIIEMCTARLKSEADDYKVTEARTLAASSCIADIAVDLHDSTLCPFAFFDRERCLRVLNATVPLSDEISGCTQTSPDNASMSKCLWNLAREEDSYAICRTMAPDRIERYGCLGELGSYHHDLSMCNEAFNDLTLRFCLRNYIDANHNAREVCTNATYAKIMSDC
jgi:hypothetical protein